MTNAGTMIGVHVTGRQADITWSIRGAVTATHGAVHAFATAHQSVLASHIPNAPTTAGTTIGNSAIIELRQPESMTKDVRITSMNMVDSVFALANRSANE